MTMAACSFFIAALASLAGVTHATNYQPSVQIANGTIQGVHSTEYNQDFFLGIPYAQPPLGDLRFRPARPLNTTWSTPYQATQYSKECYGYGSDQWVLGNQVSEDCLTINVIRPSGVQNAPVAAWIHGGGYVEGGNLDPRYNMSFIVEQSVKIGKPIVAVQMNYRLAQFGFLYSPELAQEGGLNLGLQDQRLALHWIQENIAAFGGDPSKTTIWGESAGAGSVGAHLVAYGGRDDKLFRAAIQESGAVLFFNGNPPNETTYTAILNATDCTDLACLRTKTSEQLNAVFNSSVTEGAGFGPVIDGDFIRERGSIALNSGAFVKVPVIQGANHDEGTAFGPVGINTTAQFLAYIKAEGANDTVANTFAALYPDIPEIGIPGTTRGRILDKGYMYKRTSAYGGDYAMHAPRRFSNQAWAKQNVSSYAYHWNVLVNGVPATVGATHFQEVAFVFDNELGVGYENAVAVDPFANEPSTFDQLAQLMSRLWISFMHDLDPSYCDTKWPVYTLDNPQNLYFDVNISKLAEPRPDLYRAEAIQYMIGQLNSSFSR